MSDKERLENMSPVGFDLDGNVLLKGEDYHWLMEQAEKAEKYREALEQIANSDGWLIEPNPLCTVDEAYGRCVEKARQALEGENNEQ